VSRVQVAGAELHRRPGPAAGGFSDGGSERWYRISDVDALAPFLVALASDGDHWMFLSSTGALTAGRRSPDHALFPYTTDDRLHDAAEHTGPRTIVRVRGEEGIRLWEPFSVRGAGLYRTSRDLAKNVTSNKLRFEEVNHDLGLTFTYQWMTSGRFGFVRRASLRNDGAAAVHGEILDGVQNLMPAGLGRRFQMEYSTLADGYKDSELDAATGLAMFRLSSIPVDAAEPSEALRTTAVWSAGLDDGATLLSSRQLEAYRHGEAASSERRVRGQRGAYFRTSGLALAPGQQRVWYLVADVEQDAAAVAATLRRLRAGGDLGGELEEDVARGTRNLIRIVAEADGLQLTADEPSCVRHFTNVLFNVMRGGIPDRGYTVSREDLDRFVAASSRAVHGRQAGFLGTLPATIEHGALLAAARDQGDPDLERIVAQYLPLTFSRRHGDPSRPWNIFEIAPADRAGNKTLAYQGNWRDIFQNWEALAHAFPGYLESMIVKFACASTADGHNPYRVTREGFEWEVHDPHDAWSHIGYWGDHQVIYQLKLLELLERHFPGRLAALLRRPVFSHANVPYRIRPYPAMLADPQQTIDFDEAEHRAALQRAAALGADGKLLLAADGAPVRVTLAEKLLVTALAKLASFVPQAGLWLNTQRPEWNDANNALVGHGASLVTLCYLRRFLRFVRARFDDGSYPLSAEVAQVLRAIAAALTAHLPAGDASDERRKRVLDAVAQPWSEHRARVYQRGFSGQHRAVAGGELRGFCDTALRHLDDTLAASRRGDGLYHAYNLISIEEGAIRIRRLPEMLEGQVAVLSSGALSAEAAVTLLDALRASALYRPDEESYLLYPDRILPGFRERNLLPTDAVQASPLLTTMLERGDRRVVSRDVEGAVHFDAAFRNVKELRRALGELGGELAPLAAAEQAALCALYERVFDHQSFTGRSGAFYKYEGLGCIYWHMVSKLLVAVAEMREEAGRAHATPAVREALARHHREIGEGLGVHRSPARYGAFPIDPHSHTPSFAGAQQPGLTGQVKEDIIARWAALGLVVAAGCLTFDPELVDRNELLDHPALFRHLDVAGREQELPVDAGALAFTCCQVPVVLHRGGPRRVLVTRTGGAVWEEGLVVDAETSAELFRRTGVVRRLNVFLGL
jgi:hypothetical protein